MIIVDITQYVRHHGAPPPTRGRNYCFHFLIADEHVEFLGSYQAALDYVTKRAQMVRAETVVLLPYRTVTGPVRFKAASPGSNTY